LWADKFDGDFEDVFKLQDKIATGVVGSIAPKLEQSEITVDFRLGRIARFGSTASVWSNADKPRTSSPSCHLPILRSYSSKSWLVPRFSLRTYCTAKAVGKALPLAAIVPQMLMTPTLQERLMLELSSFCPMYRWHGELRLANEQLTPAAGPGAIAISPPEMPDKVIPVTG
jgi:hypothetical protein